MIVPLKGYMEIDEDPAVGAARELKEEINKIFVEDENYQNLFVTILPSTFITISISYSLFGVSPVTSI